MVPEGWTKKILGDVVDFLDGKRIPLKSEDRALRRGPYPYYGATGIIDWINDYVFDDHLILLGEDGENILSRSLPHAFEVRGKTWVNNHAHVLKCRDEMDATFLTAWLVEVDYRPFNTGSTQPKLNKAVCQTIPVLVPPLPEQQKIAEILGTWDKAIETTEALLANARTQKRALMQSLLTGTRRFPGFEDHLWREVRLGDVCELQTGPFGSQLHAHEYLDHSDGVAVVMPKAMTDGGIDFGACDYISLERAKDLSKHLLRSGDVVFSRRGDVARTSIYKSGSVPAICGTGCLRARSRPDFHPPFLAILVQLDETKGWLVDNSVGQTMPNMNTTILASLPLNQPPVPEQMKIAEVLDTAEVYIVELGLDLATLRTEKKSLMQQLLTGKRRVVV